MKSDRLAMWMRRHGEHITTYRLTFGDLDAEAQLLGEWDAVGPAERNDLSKDIVEAAQHHCDEIGSSCKYRLQAQDKADAIVFATNLRQQPDESMMTDGLKTMDDASATGVTAQAIRHTEYMTQMMVRGMGQIMKVQSDQVEQLQRHLAAMQKREDQVMEVARQIAVTSDDAVDRERAADRWDRLLNTVQSDLGPAVLRELGLLPASTADPSAVTETSPSTTPPPTPAAA